MKLGSEGAAYFVEEVPDEENIEKEMYTSPIPSVHSSPLSSGKSGIDDLPDFSLDMDSSELKQSLPSQLDENISWGWGSLPSENANEKLETDVESGKVVHVPFNGSVKIAARTNFYIRVPVLHCGSFVTFTYKTKNYDINFDINYVDLAVFQYYIQDNKTKLFHQDKVNSHIKKQKSGIISPGEGYIELVWDNSYSFYNSKHLEFNVDCLYGENQIPYPVVVKTRFGYGLLNVIFFIIQLCRSDSICIVSFRYGRGYIHRSEIEVITDDEDCEIDSIIIFIIEIETASIVTSLKDDLENDNYYDEDEDINVVYLLLLLLLVYS